MDAICHSGSLWGKVAFQAVLSRTRPHEGNQMLSGTFQGLGHSNGLLGGGPTVAIKHVGNQQGLMGALASEARGQTHWRLEPGIWKLLEMPLDTRGPSSAAAAPVTTSGHRGAMGHLRRDPPHHCHHQDSSCPLQISGRYLGWWEQLFPEAQPQGHEMRVSASPAYRFPAAAVTKQHRLE